MKKLSGRPERETIKHAARYCPRNHRISALPGGCPICVVEDIGDVIARHGGGFEVEIHGVTP